MIILKKSLGKFQITDLLPFVVFPLLLTLKKKRKFSLYKMKHRTGKLLFFIIALIQIIEIGVFGAPILGHINYSLFGFPILHHLSLMMC